MKVRWRHLETNNVEEAEFAGQRVQGTVRSASGETQLSYLLAYDAAWRTKSIKATTPEAELLLESDGEGHWLRDGMTVPALEGCIDLDLETSPLTNTLPIRRLGLRPGESRTLRVTYVHVPSLEVVAVSQTYTCLEEGRRYRYAGHPPGFSADITVDQEGIVVDYPGLFQRE